MKTEKDILSLWTPLPGEYGEYFTIKDISVAGVQANRFILWQNGEIKFETRTSMQCGSYPRWANNGIFWNDNRLDLQSNNFFSLDIMKKEYFENRVIPNPAVKIYSGYKPVTFAWSVNSDFFIVSAEGADSNGNLHSKLLMLNRDGTLANILWEGSDLAPRAVCINSEYIIAGTRDILIFKTDGKPAGSLPGELLAQRIQFSENGKLVMIQDYESVILLEPGSWKIMGSIAGPWLNATLGPDGKMIYAIDFNGNLNVALITDSIETFRQVPVPDPMATIDAGNDYIVGSFAHGDPVRWVKKNELDNSIYNYSRSYI